VTSTVNKRALVFPGQGSQAVGMGADVYARYDVARATFDEAGEALGYDIARLCFEGPADRLARTDLTQPALLTTSVALVRVLDENGLSYEAALGHSLGEYSALVATGALGFVEALELVRLRGEAMQAAAGRRPGVMAAVLGLADEAVEELCARVGGVWPANYNSPGQVVVSGGEEAVDEVGRRAGEAGARRVVRLAVSGAFHSPFMEPAVEALAGPLRRAEFAEPRPAFFSTCSVAFESGDLGELLLRQIVSPVRFEQAVRRLREEGYGAFLEVGPGSVLSGLIRRIDASAAALACGDAAALASARGAGWITEGGEGSG
jgi:[acyl-carrier-protein] S-malonyltransferase